MVLEVEVEVEGAGEGEGEAGRLRSGTRGTLDQALKSVSLFTFTDKRGCRDLSIGDSPMDSKETNWEGRWQTKETQVKGKKYYSAWT